MSEPYEYKNFYFGLSTADAEAIREAPDGSFVDFEIDNAEVRKILGLPSLDEPDAAQ